MRRSSITSAALLVAASAAAQTHDIDGHSVNPLKPSGKAGVVFVIASDCPISNAYAPTMAAICHDYSARGVSCTLAYEDLRITPDAVRKHVADYSLRPIPATIDASRGIADRAHAEITPTAIVVDSRGEIRYKGRIDNLYINIGRTRQQVTSHDLTDALDAVLTGKPIQHPQTEALGCYIERGQQGSQR